MNAHPLSALLAPRSVVVLTGPEGQRTAEAEQLLAQLSAQPFQGPCAILDAHVRGSLADLAQSRADLAILALPESEWLSGVELASRIGCRAALIVGSGVSADRAVALQRLARREGLLLAGPNGSGLMTPRLGLNASLMGPLVPAGGLAVLSQSGSLTAALLDGTRTSGVGFSTVVALGPHPGVDLAALLLYLAVDPHTHSIVVHLEGLTQARPFMSALRLAAHAKPVVVLKTGRREEGRSVAQTHSQALAGHDDVFDAALRRAGAVRVNASAELLAVAKCLGVLGRGSRPVQKGLALVSNGGGPAVLAADWAERVGLAVTAVQDLSRGGTPGAYTAAVLAAQSRADTDAVLVLHAPLLDSPGADCAQALLDLKPELSKPVLACWMGEGVAAEARTRLGAAGIPCFRTPEAAVGALAHVAAYHRHQHLLQQTPSPLSPLPPPDLEGARLLIDTALAQRRSVLSEVESKALLAAFRIPVTGTLRARSAHDAMLIATQLGFPVALKIDSDSLPHKTEVNGVMLDLRDARAVHAGYDRLLEQVRRALPGVVDLGVTVQPMAGKSRARELHVGLIHEPSFGPVVVFGAGGTQVEWIRDCAMELPPLNRFLARQLMMRTRTAVTLDAWRGAPAVQWEALEALLLRVSEMACELPQLREMDINPVLADEHGVVAVDARIVLAAEAPATVTPSYAHLAIRPYPAHLAHPLALRDGRICQVRPIQPDDAERLQALVASLSPESRYNRFAATLTELPPRLLAQFTLIDYEREMALLALYREAPDQPERIAAVARYTSQPDGESAEFSLLVADGFAGQGLGSRMMESLFVAAREQGLQRLDGLVLKANTAMLRLVRGLGFSIEPCSEEPDFRLVRKPL
ncbi:bifunctional acetate--CoA ligase family protein/GNAT family N-acetyltransferase [Inhella gelatinilytica]|uniref:GNAT family N-acetyltransferase n=1 Tax=Inhella gelatinilytica TaxID=2795030 RepID=A0A931NDJ6_9BURK|nr:GNAT family N-acetyltransferase [Inhella gelatinilytica]MBH9552305.1 GNAT family N-acetyltransferase [Inhella gelatinilytica]